MVQTRLHRLYSETHSSLVGAASLFNMLTPLEGSGNVTQGSLSSLGTIVVKVYRVKMKERVDNPSYAPKAADPTGKIVNERAKKALLTHSVK